MIIKSIHVSEKAFQGAVIDLAGILGWLVYHVPDSRRVTSAGFPDLVMARSGRVIFAELKSEKGKLSREQECWIENLENENTTTEVYVWRPKDLNEIEEVLK